MADSSLEIPSWESGLDDIDAFFGPSSPMPSEEAPPQNRDGQLDDIAEPPHDRHTSGLGDTAGLPAAVAGEDGESLIDDEFQSLLDDIEQFSSDYLRDDDSKPTGGVSINQAQASTRQVRTSSLPATPPLFHASPRAASSARSNAQDPFVATPVLPSSSAKSYMQEEMRTEDKGSGKPYMLPPPNYLGSVGTRPLFARDALPVDLGRGHPVFGYLSPESRKSAYIEGRPITGSVRLQTHGSAYAQPLTSPFAMVSGQQPHSLNTAGFAGMTTSPMSMVYHDGRLPATNEIESHEFGDIQGPQVPKGARLGTYGNTPPHSLSRSFAMGSDQQRHSLESAPMAEVTNSAISTAYRSSSLRAPNEPIGAIGGHQMSVGARMSTYRPSYAGSNGVPSGMGIAKQQHSLANEGPVRHMSSPTSRAHHLSPFTRGRRPRENTPPPPETSPQNAQKVTPVKKPPAKKSKLTRTNSAIADAIAELQSTPPSAARQRFTTPRKSNFGAPVADTKKPATPNNPATPKSTSTVPNLGSSSKKSAQRPRLSNFPPEKDHIMSPQFPAPAPPVATTQQVAMPKNVLESKAKTKRRTKSTNTSDSDVFVDGKEKQLYRKPRNSVTDKELRSLVTETVMRDVKKKFSPRKTRGQKDAEVKAAPNPGAAAKRRHTTGGAGK